MAPSLFSGQVEFVHIGYLLEKKKKKKEISSPKPERNLQTDLCYSLKQIEKYKNN